MNISGQRFCAWCGPFLVVVFFIGFWPVAGFMPPPSPLNTAAQTAAAYAVDPNRVRIGLLMGLFVIPLIVFWAGVQTAQMRRIEGEHSALSYAQLGLAVIAPVFFIVPMMFWLIAAFRQRSPEDVQLLNDIGWLFFVGAIFSGPPWPISVGATILRDRRAEPIFPRWAGYYNIWVGILFIPGAICVFFQSGPFAWNGIFAFWLVIVAFATWVLVQSALILRAIDKQSRMDDPAAPVPAPLDRR